MSTAGAKARVQVNPYEVAGAFLAYCVSKGWLEREGCGRSCSYYVTGDGMREIEDRFGIVLGRAPIRGPR